MKHRQSIPLPALALGLGGLLPFAFGAALIFFGNGRIPAFAQSLPLTTSHSQLAPLILGAYGAVILSFLGGIRWGNLLERPSELGKWAPLGLSVIPSLLAWVALLLSPPLMLSLLIAGFILQYMLDTNGVAQGILPAWFGTLRLLLTSIAVLCLIVGLFGTISLAAGR